ncbi:DUF397 domain-containing protein [Actinacidiphila acididurans]|uniref:DUF397 domain-containing protein n=1 Tax=Actinacidiphila acididurans TaxID=2784346 RepID=UPI003557E8D8
MSLEATVGDDGMIYIRETDEPDVVAVTTPAKWEAFVKGVKAGEFDHFVDDDSFMDDRVVEQGAWAEGA